MGDEKQSILEKTRIQGSTNILPNAEWQRWHIAIGAIETRENERNRSANKPQPITLLIPPEMGKMHSGE